MNLKYLSLKSAVRIKLSGYIFITLALISCTSNAGDDSESSAESLPEEKNLVDVILLERGDFTREIISNGKLSAIQKAELYFKNPGIIGSINYRNGQTAPKGSELARLRNDEYRFSLEKAEVNMKKAEIDRMDALLSMGYKEINSSIPEDHLQIANIRSGYNQAKIQLEEAEYELQNAVLKAPFTGKVVGIKQKTFERTNSSEPFCTLINDSRFTIDFPLLETEIGQVQTGQKVTVTPVAGAKEITGTVMEINPRIDENGLAWVKAEVNNPGGYLEGMNVKVSIKKSIPGKLVVPKQAVVLRQNQEVLFRYTGGIAYWTYVNVLDENEHYYSVVAREGATLEPGDTVIVSNNLNLAHESEVEIE
jgi:RND family efflux transporter MFP subunit